MMAALVDIGKLIAVKEHQTEFGESPRLWWHVGDFLVRDEIFENVQSLGKLKFLTCVLFNGLSDDFNRVIRFWDAR